MSATDHDHDPYPSLPQALDRSLRRATGHTLTSLVALRKALGEHVLRERKRGASLPEIEPELKLLVSRAHDESSEGRAGAEHRDNLSAQVVQWTGAFFRTVD